ncbi:LamG-like jellyroll fold domain-containing protein [Nonomuraea sp. NPDC050478]|uniref:LamG-like jellyroll fold domain-containing protein n=1 Tax=Nonomuraea sp. NPDC050478 TaxID=3364365 RepID=UPI0037897D72
MLPGLFTLSVDPAQADSLIADTNNAEQADVVVPKQMMGTAGVLPGVVNGAVTRAENDAEPHEDNPQAPVRGALPLEDRLPRAQENASSRELPSGVVRAEQREQAVLGWPLIDDTYPEHGTLTGTVTPLLTVEATSMGGGTQADFDFYYNVCEVLEEEEAGNPPPSPECFQSGRQQGKNTWRVPAGRLKWGQQYEWWVRVVDPASNSSDQSDRQSFTTGPRQPLNSSLLGAGGDKEFSPVPGNYATTVTDAQVSVAGPPLAVTRTYNSLDTRTDGIFGAGWSTVWDMKLVEEPDGLLVHYPDGRRLRFADKGDGSYQPPPGMQARLAEVDSGGWRLMDKSSTSFYFDSSGRLLRISDARGREQTLEYGGDGKMSRATATGGRSLHFTWSGSRVASVSTDPVDGVSATWTYTYSGDTLTSVCAPVAAPNCATYSYQDGSRYRGLVRDSDPVGYWRLGDAQYDPAANEGSDGRSGVYKSVTPGRPGALGGSTDTAGGFTKSYVQLPFYLLSRLQDRVSIEAWFKTSQNGIILSAGEFGYEFGATEPVVYVGTDGRLRGQMGFVRNSSGSWLYTPVTSPGPVNDDQWHHVVLNVDGARQQLFLDGQSVGVLNGTLEPNFRAEAFIGSGDRASRWSIDTPGGPNTSGAFAFKGSIDEFAIYGKPLTEAEIQGHYAAGAVAPNKLKKITRPSGRVWAENTYDTATDRLKIHTDHHGGTWQLGKPSSDWTTKVATVKVTDPRNGTVTHGYDEWRGNRIVHEIDQENFKVEYKYDTGGFLSRVTDRNGNVTRQYNDKRGNVLSVRTCRTSNTCHREYATYHVDEDDEFDPLNDRQLTYRDARSSGETDNRYLTKIEYNEYGEQIKETTPPTPDFPNGRSISVTYTDGTEPAVNGGTAPAGLLKTWTDPKNNTWTLRYTASGDLGEQTEPTGLVSRFEYDALGRVKTSNQISQAHPGGVKTTFTYDHLGRPLTQTGPGIKNEISNATHTAQIRYTYDPDGNKLTETIADLTGGDPERTTTYTYDDHSNGETSTGPEGGVVRSTWNNLGLVDTITDEVGSVFGHTYTKRGELATRTLKNWTGSPVNPQPATEILLESRSYDAGGRLAATVLATAANATGRKTSYKYFGDNLLSEVIADGVKLNGSTTPKNVVLEKNTYDAAGNRTSMVTGGGLTHTDYAYDAAGRLTSTILDPGSLPTSLNRRTVFEYDANNLTTKETRTGAGSTREEIVSYAYNAAGIKTRQTVENGDQDLITTWTVDDRGLITAVTDPRGNADGATAAHFTTDNRYDALGRLIEAKAPAVQVDKAGAEATSTRPTVRSGYDTSGNQTHQVDAEGRTLTTAYDKASRVVAVTSPAYTPPGGTAVTPSITHQYDPAGRLVKTTDPRGYDTTLEYDALGNLVRTTDPGPSGPGGVSVAEYDLIGQQLAAVDPTGARVQATYDDLGRKITQTEIERRPSNAAYITQFTYNDASFLTKAVAPGNKTTSYVVNAAGEVTSATDPANNTTTNTYDLAGRLLRVRDATLNATATSYDLAGRPIEVKSLNGDGDTLRTIGLGYDPAGNVISETSAEQHTIRHAYDALNRLTSLTEPVKANEEIVTRFGYDATGARTRLTDGRGNATWTTYNSLGLVERVIEPATAQHPNEADRTWTYSYDQAGNNTTILQPGGVRIDRTYDHLGRLTQENGSGGGSATAERTLGYDSADRLTTAGDYTLEYNDRGLLTKMTPPTGQPITMAYDANGNLTQRVDAAGTANFTWDHANRAATATDPVTGRTWTYGYDKANRVTSLTSTNPANTHSIGYDDMGRATSQTLKSGSGSELAKITYGWDLDDNLTTKTTSGLAGSGTNTYGYDHANRLTSWTAPNGTTTAYEWDAAGNRTKAGAKTYTYDERNRLTSGDGTDYTYTPRGTLASQTKAGVTTQLTFDAFDRLIADGDSLYSYDDFDRVTRRIRGTSNQTFVYSGPGNDLAAISTSGTVDAKYARDAFGALLGLQEGTDPATAAFNDLHGDLVGTFTGTGIAGSTAYDPFGEITAETGLKAGLGYQGEYTDPDTGKVNMHARWYQPGTGTFASRDTATLNPNPSVQANRYTYANASPLTGTDPTGHSTVQNSFGGPGGWGDTSPGYSGNLCGISQGIDVCGGSGGSGGLAVGYSYSGGGPIGCIGIYGLEQCSPLNFGFALALSEAELKKRNILPNGDAAPRGFWSESKNFRHGIYNAIYAGASSEEIAQLWKDYKTKDRPPAAAGKNMDPDDPGYVLWWAGMRIKFPSRSAAIKFMVEEAGRNPKRLCLSHTCMEDPGAWLLRTERYLANTYCGKRDDCVKDEKRGKAEIQVKLLLTFMGVPPIVALSWSGDHGIEKANKKSSKPPSKGGVYVLVDKKGKPIYVGETGDFEDRRAQHAESERCKKVGCRMLILFRVQNINIRKGIENIFQWGGDAIGYWNYGVDEVWHPKGGRMKEGSADFLKSRKKAFEWLGKIGIGLRQGSGRPNAISARRGGSGSGLWGYSGSGASWRTPGR